MVTEKSTIGNVIGSLLACALCIFGTPIDYHLKAAVTLKEKKKQLFFTRPVFGLIFKVRLVCINAMEPLFFLESCLFYLSVIAAYICHVHIQIFQIWFNTSGLIAFLHCHKQGYDVLKLKKY